MVVLADGPELAPAAVERVVAAWRESGAPLVAASYGGVRGHPLLVDRSAWADIPDEGLRAHEPLLVPCDDLGAPGDVDYPEDLPERFRRAPGRTDVGADAARRTPHPSRPMSSPTAARLRPRACTAD